MKLRSARATRHLERPLEDSDALPAAASLDADDPRDCPSRRASAAELSTILRRAVEQLPPSYREILMLRDLNELDTDTTARLLACTPANVKTRLHRARRALRRLLAPTICV